MNSSVSGPLLLGKVKIWGEIVEHEAGYRSQFGKIVSLDYGDPELQAPENLRGQSGFRPSASFFAVPLDANTDLDSWKTYRTGASRTGLNRSARHAVGCRGISPDFGHSVHLEQCFSARSPLARGSSGPPPAESR